MKIFVKKELWEGNWCFKPSKKIDFSTFEKLDFSSNPVLKKEKISIEIETLENIESPSKHQIETLKFIFENQDEIMSSIYSYHRNVIFPIENHMQYIEEYEIVNSFSELNKVYGLTSIEIPMLTQENNIYFRFDFDFCYDPEHGLTILFENTLPIDSFESGIKDSSAIYIRKNELKNLNGEPLKFHIKDIINNETIVKKGSAFFDENIHFSLKEGIYDIYICCNETNFTFKSHIKNDLEQFSLKKIIITK